MIARPFDSAMVNLYGIPLLPRQLHFLVKRPIGTGPADEGGCLIGARKSIALVLPISTTPHP